MQLEEKNKRKLNGLEEIIAELKKLAKIKRLSETDLARAKELMCKLKELDWTNKEISDVVAGRWKELTLKLYTRGVAVKDPDSKRNVVEIIGELEETGLSLEDVKAFMSLKEDLDSKGISIMDISNLLDEATGLDVSLKEIVQMQSSLKNSGLSIRQLNEILVFKTDLDNIGLTLKSVDKVLQTSKVYGDADEVLEALKIYGTLNGIREDLMKISSDKEQLGEQINKLKSEVLELANRKGTAENILKTYEKIKMLGFDESTYDRLKAASEKYKGINVLLDAINTFIDINEITKKKSDLEVELKKTEADHAHLMSIIWVCDELLYKYKFSIQTINDIYGAAKIFGEPLNVLNAVNKFGEIRKIEVEINVLENRRIELRSAIKELEEQVQDLRGTIRALRNSIEGALIPIKDEITKNVDYMNKKFEEALNTVSSQYDNYIERFGELKAEAGKLEEDLKLGRIMLLLIKYPSEARQVPLEYDALILSGIVNHCRAMGINPTLKLQEVVGAKHWAIGNYTVELIDLLEWALKGLKKATPHG